MPAGAGAPGDVDNRVISPGSAAIGARRATSIRT
jgi:hypothetical protein